jgi:apolipoprotein N-acyltransferase
MNQPVTARLAALAGWPRAALAGAVGAVAALGQAPFDLWPLVFPAFAVLLLVIATAQTPRAAARVAWVAGTAHFAVALHWIVEPFFVDAARHGWMAPFALILMAGGMALFWAFAAWVGARLTVPGAVRIWGLAGALVLAEWLRATVLTGFPWAHPGHALIGSGWLAAAAWIGPHGLSMLVLFGAALAAWLVMTRRSLVGLAVLVPWVALGLVPLAPTAPQPAADAPVIRLIQPNAPQHLKWRPDMIPVFFQRGLDLTAAAPVDAALGAPDLIVWPETSLPVLLGRSDTARAAISDAAGDVPVIVGAQRYAGSRPRNGLAVLDGVGDISAIYDKHHLVPFGEYLPLEDQLARLGAAALAATLPGGFRPGDGPALLDMGPLGRAFPMICYEAIFPGYIRQMPRPDWMLHITNDAWFGTFSGPYQHLALARLRAAEQGLPVLRAANTGISAVIDARGRVTSALALNGSGVLDARLPPPLPATPYARTGDWPVLIAVILAMAAAGVAGRSAPLRRGT